MHTKLDFKIWDNTKLDLEIWDASKCRGWGSKEGVGAHNLEMGPQEKKGDILPYLNIFVLAKVKD